MIAEVHRKTWNEMIVKMIADSHIFSSISHNFVMAFGESDAGWIELWQHDAFNILGLLTPNFHIKMGFMGASSLLVELSTLQSAHFLLLWNYELKFSSHHFDEWEVVWAPRVPPRDPRPQTAKFETFETSKWLFFFKTKQKGKWSC